MTELNDVNDLFDTLAKILWRCFLLGYLVLLLWFAMYVFAGNVIFGSHGKLFGLTEREMGIIHYCGMAVFKCAALLFFLFPYIAIRLVLRKRT